MFIALAMTTGVSAATRSFTITARQFSFAVNPSPFVVNQGDTVSVDLTSADVTHGFFVEHYFTSGTTVFKGQHQTITFVANTAGTFTYFCTVFCGEGHPTMSGTLVVNAAPNPPMVTAFAPHSGSVNGGTVVLFSGTGFQNGATVKFGELAAVSVVVNSATSVSAIAPAHAAGAVVVTITNPDGQTATAGTYQYIAPSPSITSIAPSSGSTAGGTTITISGTNFGNAATVMIGGVAATDVNVVSTTTITAVTPAHAAGPVDVVVTIGQTSVTSTAGFTYQAGGKKRRAVAPH